MGKTGGDTKKRTTVRVGDEALRGFVGYNVKRAMVAFQGDLRVVLEPLGLRTVTFSALTLVDEKPGLSQSQLAQALAVERPNLVAVIDELSGRGLMTRERVPTDRRTYALHLTEEGRRILVKATADISASEEKRLAGFTPAERDLLVKMLNQIERPARGRS